MFASIFALLMFSAVLIWIGSIYSQKTESSEFHLAGRKASTLKIAASTFTLIGGGEFVTLTALSYFYGVWSIIFFLGVAIGFLVLSMLTSRARKYALAGDFHSLPDFFFFYFGKKVSISSTILASISLSALLLIQLVVGGLMLGVTTGIPVTVCIIGMAVVVCTYVYLGGFNGVLATDLIQAIVMFSVIALIVFAYTSTPSGTSNELDSTLPPLSEMAALLIGGFCAVLGGADVWQRVLSGRDDSSVRKGLLVNAAGWLIFGTIIIIVALKIKSNFPSADPNNAFFLLLESGLPAWLTAMVALLLFSALLPTADTELFVLSVITNKEIMRAKSKLEIHTKNTRTYVIIITIIVSSLAIFVQQLVDIYFILLYFMMILGPVSLARLLGRGNTALAFFGMLGGVTILVFLIFSGNLLGAYPLLILVPPLATFLVSGKNPKNILPGEAP